MISDRSKTEEREKSDCFISVRHEFVSVGFALLLVRIEWNVSLNTFERSAPKSTMRIKNMPGHSVLLTLAYAVTIACCLYHDICEAFVAPQNGRVAMAANKNIEGTTRLFYNIYDDWRSDAVVDTMYLDEENVRDCLEEFIESDYGTTMFGCHARAASIGITGSIDFVEICGPEVTLSLSGKFWHKRSTVLGRAAMWLNARIPEITDVVVADVEDLQDFEEIVDELSGDVLFRKDKRSEDFNGDRGTMEYQGCVYS